MKKGKYILHTISFACLLFLLFTPVKGLAQKIHQEKEILDAASKALIQQEPQKKTDAQAEQTAEEIEAGPTDIREKIGVPVFLGWMWICLIVLIYFLILKVKETDRLYELNYLKDRSSP